MPWFENFDMYSKTWNLIVFFWWWVCNLFLGYCYLLRISTTTQNTITTWKAVSILINISMVDIIFCINFSFVSVRTIFILFINIFIFFILSVSLWMWYFRIWYQIFHMYWSLWIQFTLYHRCIYIYFTTTYHLVTITLILNLRRHVFS